LTHYNDYAKLMMFRLYAQVKQHIPKGGFSDGYTKASCGIEVHDFCGQERDRSFKKDNGVPH